MKIEIICKTCGYPFMVKPRRQFTAKFCSRDCIIPLTPCNRIIRGKKCSNPRVKGHQHCFTCLEEIINKGRYYPCKWNRDLIIDLTK